MLRATVTETGRAARSSVGCSSCGAKDRERARKTQTRAHVRKQTRERAQAQTRASIHSATCPSDGEGGGERERVRGRERDIEKEREGRVRGPALALTLRTSSVLMPPALPNRWRRSRRASTASKGIDLPGPPPAPLADLDRLHEFRADRESSQCFLSTKREVSPRPPCLGLRCGSARCSDSTDSTTHETCPTAAE